MRCPRCPYGYFAMQGIKGSHRCSPIFSTICKEQSLRKQKTLVHSPIKQLMKERELYAFAVPSFFPLLFTKERLGQFVPLGN